MPRIDGQDELVGDDALLAEREAFESGFKQSPRTGNWWRTYLDESGRVLTLTIYFNRYGKWQFCVADSCGPHWSRGSWTTEGEAMETLWLELSEGSGAA